LKIEAATMTRKRASPESDFTALRFPGMKNLTVQGVGKAFGGLSEVPERRKHLLLDIMAILADESIGRPEKPCLSGNRRKMGIMTGGTLKVVDIA
jgi:hypothetical protein